MDFFLQVMMLSKKLHTPPAPAPRAFMAFFPASDDAWLSPPRPELEASDDLLSKNGLLFKLSPPHPPTPLHSTP